MHLNNPHGLPRFLFAYSPAGAQVFDGPDVIYGKNGFSVCMEHYNIRCEVFETENTATVVLGHPIIGERVDAGAVAHMVREASPERSLAGVNGEFLVISVDFREKAVRTVTDRFTSISLFHHQAGGVFVGSVFYNDMWNYLGQTSQRSISPYPFFEFLYFQRVFGDKTYDAASRFQKAATVLNFRDGRTSSTPYWQQDYTKTTRPLGECAQSLVGLLKQSVKRKTSDAPGRVGLFLSGGKDSRTVLSSFETPPVCFTLTPGKNAEFLSASEAVNIRGGRHVHLDLPDDPYSGVVDQLTRLSGGMFVFDHALFYGYEEEVRRHADVVFHGHGIDYMFQGMYVPSKVVRIWGKTQWRKLVKLPADVARFFIDNVSYKVKVVSPFDLLKPGLRDDFRARQYEAMQELVEESSSFCNTPHDSLEYFLNHAISRHYPYTNLTSMGTCAEQRTLTFDNDIFDLYLSLPMKYRLNARMAIETLRRSDPRLAAIINNNTGMPASHHAWQREAFIVRRRVLKWLGLWRADRIPHDDSDRTWPHRLTLLQQHEKMNRLAMEMASSEALDGLGFLDMDQLGKLVPQWIQSPPHRHIGGIIYHLITLDRFLKQ